MSYSAEFMIKANLIAIGADGLCNPDEECGCDLDDLAPCDCLNLRECKAAMWKNPAPGEKEYDEDRPRGYFQVIE